MSCQNNMRQLGIGLHLFHDTHRVFPASGWTMAGPGNPAGKFVGWRPMVLPYLEQENVRALYNFELNWWEEPNLSLAGQWLDVFVCPSTISRAGATELTAKPPRPAITAPRPLGPTDYEAIMGVQPCVDPVHYATQETNRSVMFRNSRVSMGHISDGSSNTICVVECAARPLVFQGRKAVPGLFNDQGQGWADSEGPFSLDGSNEDGTIQCLGLVQTPRAINATNGNEPYAFHPQGANMLYADGHMSFVADTVSLKLFAAQVTHKGNETTFE